MTGETEKDVSGWTTDTLRSAVLAELDHVRSEIENLRVLLNERYETQNRSIVEARESQQTAMRAALEAAEKAVNVALLSAEKAVTKAEAAAEKRFEATNEFRGQLQDMVATLMNRNEADAKFDALASRIGKVESKIDTASGHTQGISEQVVTRRLDTGQLLTVVGVLIAAATIVILIANQ